MADNWMLKAVLTAKDMMSPELAKIAKNASKTRKYLLDVGKASGKLGQTLGLPVGVGGGLLAALSVSAIKNAMVSMADMADEVQKFTFTTGIAGSEFKKFQYLAKVSNVPFEAMTGSMGKLNKQIYDAANGKNKDLAALFNKLHISMRGSNGQLRSAADMLPELADAFQRNQNPVVRARMGMTMFGKSWQEIMPMLADGSEKINQRMARFRELGLEVKDLKAFESQMSAADEFGDKLDDLNFVSKGLQNTIAKELIPVLTPLLNDFIRWTVANRELIAGEVKTFVAEIAESIRTTDWRGLINSVRDFIGTIKSIVGAVGGGKNALIGLFILINMPTIMAFLQLGGAVFRLGRFLYGLAGTASVLRLVGVAMRGIGIAIATTPLGIVLALATAALLIWQNWDKLKQWFGEFFNWIGEKFQKLLGWAGELVDAAAKFLGFQGGDVSQVGVDPLSTTVGDSTGGADLINAGRVRASGKIEVSFANAPPGMRVDQSRATGDVPIDTSVGYRSFALGMP